MPARSTLVDGEPIPGRWHSMAASFSNILQWGGGQEKRQEKTKFIHFWSIGSLRKKSPDLLSVSLGSPGSQPSSLLPWSQKQPCTAPNHSRSSRARHSPKSGYLPMKRAQQHCYWAQHLLTGFKRLRGQVTMEERIFMAPVWAGQQHCLGQAPYSLHPLWIAPGRPPEPR